MSEGHATLLRRDDDLASRSGSALPLGGNAEPLVLDPRAKEPTAFPGESSRALALADFTPPQTGLLDAGLRWAYRLGIPASLLCAPLRKSASARLLATVETPLVGDRATGIALRAGFFLVHGARTRLTQVEFGSPSRLTPGLHRAVHGFGWLRDMAACAPREQCAAAAERIARAWLDANRETGKGCAWTVELTGQRLLAWLVHAPLLLSREDAQWRGRLLAEMEASARWLDRQVGNAGDQLGRVTGWCAVVAAGLLLPDGRPRRLYGEAGLLRALGELVSDDGGVLSRSLTAQIEAIALLIDLRACYAAVRGDSPPAIETMLGLLVPPLLALRMGDGGLGSWQGAGATPAHRLAALIEASGVRARPAKAMRHWGYQRLDAGKSVLVIDAAPPPRSRHARFGCASTLAFEFGHRDQRIVVNCGGAELAGGLVPLRIEQGLRGTAAHSTLVLDEANSTAVLIKGQIGKGVEEVDVARGQVEQKDRKAQRLEASHDGYAARYGLLHRRILMLSADGELRGEDILEPAGRRGKRGKIGFAIRFHLGAGIEAALAEDGRGAGLALPDGSYWQFRLGGDSGEAALVLDDSLWVDGQGRPQPVQQLVIEGMAPRSGGRFPWLLKKMG